MRLSAAHLRAVSTDTTNGQPALIEKLKRLGGIANLEAGKAHGEPDMTGAFYSPCVSHVADLTVEDQLKVPLFKNAHEAVHLLSTWFRASDKRIQVVLDAQLQLAPGVRPLSPSPSPRRVSTSPSCR